MPTESEHGNRQAPWLTLTGDFTQCCNRSERVSGSLLESGYDFDNSLINRINFANLLFFLLNWDIRFRIFLGDQVSSLPMRFHFGAVPSSPDFEPDVSWKSLREPSPWLAQFIALSVCVFAAALVGFLLLVIPPLQKAMPTGTLSAFVLAFVGIVVVHELIHA